MTLNACALYAYAVCLILAAIGSILTIFSVGIWFPLFAGQVALYGYTGYLLFPKIKDWQEGTKKEKSNKEKLLDEKLKSGKADLEKNIAQTAGEIKNKAIDQASKEMANQIVNKAAASG